MESIRLKVGHMTCGSCARHVEEVIQTIAGVSDVQIDLVAGTAVVEGKFPQGVVLILAALEEDGYPSMVSSDALVTKEAKSGSCKSGGAYCCY